MVDLMVEKMVGKMVDATVLAKAELMVAVKAERKVVEMAGHWVAWWDILSVVETVGWMAAVLDCLSVDLKGGQ